MGRAGGSVAVKLNSAMMRRDASLGADGAGQAACSCAVALPSETLPPCGPSCHPCTRQAFEWIAENAQFPAIMSMSVAGEMSVTVNEAARRLVEDRHIVMVGCWWLVVAEHSGG